MNKVWINKRKGVKGWWVGWYEGGKRRAKAFPNKSLAEHYRQIKYSQINSEVFTGTVTVDWQQLVEEYIHYKQVVGVTQSSIYEILLTLRHFQRIAGPYQSKQITQKVIDQFILDRSREVSRPTLNKDIRNIRAFINWGKKNKYFNGDIEIRQLKEDERPVNSLNSKQVRDLLIAAENMPTMKMRILLALGSCLRRGDIEQIRISDIDFDNNAINTRSKKTGKAMGSRPVSEPIMTELSNYAASLPEGQEKLFSGTFTHKRWKRIRERAGLAELKFHDLRKTFASMLAQRGISTAVTQRLLEHSSAELTNRVYTNVDPVLRHAVNQLPVEEWL